MSDSIPVPGHPGLSVAVARSARARRLSLRVGRADGVVRLTLPRSVSLGEAQRFVADQARWIARHVADVPGVQGIAIGRDVPVLGRMVPVVTGRTRVARYTGESVLVPDDPARVGARVQALFKTMARTHLQAASEHYAAKVGRDFGKLTLRDTRSRWGSCTSRGDLMFSWRLVMAPVEVLNYVAAHEVAHLVHMDHSARFWGQVAALMPDYAQHRAWLKHEGAGLLAWSFAGVDDGADGGAG